MYFEPIMKRSSANVIREHLKEVNGNKKFGEQKSKMKKTTFALYFGNRGFFPESLIASARQEIESRLEKLGFDTIGLDPEATRFGAIETAAEGRVYANFLKKNEGKYDGVILCLPNFGDENGASEALRDCGVPIYILAWPDELDKLDFHSRRDAFCGKLSVMDVFNQFGIPYTAWPPHTLAISCQTFAEHMKQFAAVCRIVKGLRRCRFGAIGARPTVFKTIRFDEAALQKYGITTETYDNSDLLLKIQSIQDNDPQVSQKTETFRNYSDFSLVPPDKMLTLAKASVALDRIIDENALDGIALRCWFDLEQTLKISPCVLLSELNDRGIPAACELDIANAVSMRALQLASGEPAACLDWNNNYGSDPDCCILFHCGSIPQKMMRRKGCVSDHSMFSKTLGPGNAFGCNVGRIRPMDFTFASTATVDGKLLFYSGQGNFLEEELPPEFIGCGGAARIPDLQRKINRIGKNGYRHHVSVTSGFWGPALNEAFENYLGYKKTDL